MNAVSRRLRQLLRLPPTGPAEEVWRLRRLLGAAPQRPGRLVWQGRPVAYVDGPALYWQLREIFVNGCYDLPAGLASPRIIDGGAHVGLSVLRWRQTHPDARITAFEADPAIVPVLRGNLQDWGDAATEVMAAAAWNTDGEVAFAATGTDSGHVREGAPLRVPARDLASYCRAPVDLLKLDIEGAEGVVLAHLAAAGALRQVRRLACEWHEWSENAPTLHGALDSLARHGFTYRLVEAQALGGAASPAFPRLRWPGNQLMLYAWQPGLGPAAAPGPMSPNT